MGRYAQRRVRGGGGKPPGPALLEMTVAHIPDDSDMEVTYNGAITAGDFTPGDHISQPTGNSSEGYDQLTSTSINITFPADITLDTSVDYVGSVPGILTPQSLATT